MLLSHEAKTPFIILLSCTTLSFALCLGSVIYQIVAGLLGIGVQQGIQVTCTPYQNFKLSNSNLIYLVSFVGGCLAVLMFIVIGVMMAGMLRQVVKYRKQQKKQQKTNITNKITQNTTQQPKKFMGLNSFIFGYLLFCLGTLGNLVNFGVVIGMFFVSLDCKHSIDISLLVVSCLSGTSMLSIIISFFAWMNLRSKIHQALRNMDKQKPNSSPIVVQMKEMKTKSPETPLPIIKQKNESKEIPIITVVPPVNNPPSKVPQVQVEAVSRPIPTNIVPEYQTFKPTAIAVSEKVVRSQGIQTNEQRLPVKIYYENESDGTQLVKTMYYPNENQLSQEVHPIEHKEMYPRTVNRRISSTTNFNQHENGLHRPLIQSRSNIYGDNVPFVVYHDDGDYRNSRRSYGEMGNRAIPVSKSRQSTGNFNRFQNQRYATNRREIEDRQFDHKFQGRDKYENIHWHTNEQSGLSQNEGDQSNRQLKQGRGYSFADEKQTIPQERGKEKEKRSKNRKSSKSPPKQNKLKSPPKQKLQISPIITADQVQNSLQKTQKVSTTNLNNIPVGKPIIPTNYYLENPNMSIQPPKSKSSQQNRLGENAGKNVGNQKSIEKEQHSARQKTPQFPNPSELNSMPKQKKQIDSDEYSKLVEQHRAQLRIKKEREKIVNFGENQKGKERSMQQAKKQEQRQNMFGFESSYEMNKSFQTRGSPKNKNIYLNYMNNQSSIKPNSSIFRNPQKSELQRMENVDFQKFDYDSVPKRSTSQQKFEEEQKKYFESIKFDSTLKKHQMQQRSNQKSEGVTKLHKNIKPDLNESQAQGKYFDSSLNKSRQGKQSNGKTGLLIDYLRGKYVS